MRRALRATASPRRLEELRAEARRLERWHVYGGKVYGSRVTSRRFRLKGLERACVLAKAHLRQAEQGQGAETEQGAGTGRRPGTEAQTS